jgi:hypothetical protein
MTTSGENFIQAAITELGSEVDGQVAVLNGSLVKGRDEMAER